MLNEDLIEIFERDISKLISELNSYKKEENIWAVKGEIKNSAGNLCLHLIGNLNHFIGSILGNMNYTRDREAEFNNKNVPRDMMVGDLEGTLKTVTNTLKNLKGNDLLNEYPKEVHNKKITTSYFLLRLAVHFNYHLGQINYHRRLIDQ